MKFIRTLALCAGGCALLLRPPRASAHGILGDRFFPPTVTTDDPFAVDELALPTVSWLRNPAAGGSAAFHEIDAGFEFDKEIFPHLALGISDTYLFQHPDRGPDTRGWDNLTFTAKYEFFHSEPHETILSVGLEADLGRSGNRSVASPDSAVAPVLYFGKGMGDLPDSLSALQPFAVTGSLSQHFPLSGEDSNTFESGFAIEYSIPYLQQHVRDLGIPAPFKDMTPLVEFVLSTGENRVERGLTTGTINPGVLWDSPYLQIGVEANVPLNSRSGTHVGVTVQAWIFIDDIFPHVFGHPTFGERS